jgi:hypothetical protein
MREHQIIATIFHEAMAVVWRVILDCPPWGKEWPGDEFELTGLFDHAQAAFVAAYARPKGKAVKGRSMWEPTLFNLSAVSIGKRSAM